MADGQGRGASSFLPRTLHTITVTGLVVLDLTSAEALAAVDLTAADLVGPWPACQAVGAAAQFLGLSGVVAPSSTGSGVVIAAFETHVRSGQLVLAHSEVIDSALP